MEPAYTYRARVERVVDGDTLDMFVDLGFRIWAKLRVRLHSVDTPETYGVKKDSDEYARGKAATEFVTEWLGLKPDPITGLPPKSGEVTITSHDGKRLGQGKYGRWLVVVHNEKGESLNRALLESGHAEAVEY